MSLSTRRFFVYVRNIDRLEAGEVLHALIATNLGMAGGEHAQGYMDKLLARMDGQRSDEQESQEPIADAMTLARLGIGYVRLAGDAETKGGDDGHGSGGRSEGGPQGVE